MSPDQARSDAESRIRRGLTTSAIIVGYALFVTLVPMILVDQGPTLPWSNLRPMALFGLLAVPGVVAAIAAARDARPLLMVAGFLCLLQSFVSFSGITLGFLVPGFVLLRLAEADPWPPDEVPIGRSQLAAGILATCLTLAAWVALFTLTEPRCWAFTVSPGGATAAAEVPVTGRMTVNNGMFSSSGTSESGGIAGGGQGCSSAELTIQGIGVSAVLAIGAIAVAAASPSTKRPSRPA